MSRSLILALVLTTLLAACSGGGYKSAPRNLDNACDLLRERPKYARAFAATERRWNVPVHVQMATIHQESRFVSNARTPHQFVLGIIPMGRQSSAFGYSQALDGTWDDYRASTGKRFAQRDDIWDATDFMGWYMNQTRERNGVPLTDARNQYLAYHEGHTGYARRSYTGKSWLIGVAARVEERAARYEQQLQACPV